MFRTTSFIHRLGGAVSAAAMACLVTLPPCAHAWGSKGHRIINRLAIANLPADVPAFLSTPAAIDEIVYLGPEPDRWRSPAEPELSSAQAPEHFIDLEPADALGLLPHKRLDFEAEVFASHERPEKIGLLPWQADEVWERLKSSMRDYRGLQVAHQDTQPAEQAIIFYAAWLGHYAGDGSQPLHTTIQYNGWTGPNPNDYTTSHQIHYVFESQFVNDNIQPGDVLPKMTPVHLIQGDMFDAYMAYLRRTHSDVDTVYQLEKEGGFAGTGTPASREFVAARLAAGASMLRDMIYTAWIDSAQPVPEWHAKK